MPEPVELPPIGEVVVVKVKRVLDYGVFVDLLEYENQQGFVHISEIASRWVKNIRNHVKENQVRAAKVLSIDRSKNQIDLSLTKVSTSLQRVRIDDWKKNKRAQKLLELMAKKKGATAEIAWKEIADPLLEDFESLYEAFQAVSLQGKTAAKRIAPDWADIVIEICQASIEVPQKTVGAVLTLSSGAPDGVERIKNSLVEGKKAGKATVEMFYEGGGKYAVRVTATNFKDAERDLKAVSDKVLAVLAGQGGKGKVEKTER